MLIQKIFHIKASAQETVSRLSNFRLYREHLRGVKRADSVADGVGEFEFDVNGFVISADIGMIAGENPNEFLFHSLKGNVEIAGMAEFHEIKPTLTEVTLVIDYSLKPSFYRILDSMTDSVDRFMNQQLRSLEAALNEPESVTSHNRTDYAAAAGFHAQAQLAH